MIRKKCTMCGKWVIKTDSVKSYRGDVYCNDCYSMHANEIEAPGLKNEVTK